MTPAAFLDAPAGVSGDMCLGAMVSAGLPLHVLEAIGPALGLPDVTVTARRVMRGALAAVKVDVLVGGRSADVPTLHDDPRHAHPHPHPHPHPHQHPHEHPHEHPHRGLHEVLEILH
jgi:uncharacterized protein (DUF111 family)